MTDRELAIIGEARDEYKKRIIVGCTGCRYCMPCPAGVGIPEIFGTWNDLYRFNDSDFVRSDYKWLVKDGKGAEKCVKCGKCEKICPQHLKIRELLEKAHTDLTRE